MTPHVPYITHASSACYTGSGTDASVVDGSEKHNIVGRVFEYQDSHVIEKHGSNNLPQVLSPFSLIVCL